MKINRQYYQKIVLIAASFFILGTSFWLGALYGSTHRPPAEYVLGIINQKPPEQLQSVDLGLFWEAWARLEEKYVDRAKIDRQKMVYGAIQGLAQSLKDPYTQFFPPAESKQFQEDIKGSFGGIGAEIGIRKGVLTIIAPLKGNPAERAGLKAADSILKINDTPTADLALEEAVRMIRGEVGTIVRLLIFHEGMSKPKEYAITRAIIKVVILTTEKRPDGIFVIKLNEFTESAASEFRKAVQEFADSRSQKLILDLRNNPGGYLTVAVDIASWFATAGDIIAREHYADGKEDLYRSSGYRLLENVPTVVLVNEGSASASEIVAGALRDIRGIKLIGAKTFGKGSVQEVVDISQKASLKITIAKWLTPKGTEINGKGLEPDIKVDLPETPPKGDEGKDLILEKGIEVLKEL
ncbi:MAG: S41 family peptidase [Candidatus Sungiibacteriota bacterium]